MPQLDDYTYDEVNRIKSVTETQLNSSGGWTFNLFTQNFNYDRWGNRTVNCSPCQPGVTGDVFTVDAATNRITTKNGIGMTYDAAGNQTYDATGNRWFDGENRMHNATQGGTTSHYVYDADGKRVRRIVGSTETWMIYGVDGELVAEYAAAASASSPQKEYGYRSGQMLIAAETSPLKITWLVTDHLGTPRMNIRGTGTDGGSLASVTRHDYLPFGEDLIAGIRVNGGTGQYGYEPPPDGVRQKFGSKERDNETGLDWFSPGRYFASVQGRFTSVDPLLSSGDVYTPQSWNRYAYAFNNPLRFIDPFGMYNWDASAGGSYTDEELRTRSKDKSLSRRERNDAKKALGFRVKFRSAHDQAHQAAGSSRLNSNESQSVASAANSYGTENDDNGVIVGRRSGGGPGSSWLNDDDTINVVFRDNVKKNDLVTVVTHEGQHVADAQAFLASPIANSWTDLTHYEREERAFYTGAYTAQALNMKNYPAKASIKVWERGWKESDRATKMSRAVEAYIYRGYSGLSPANPGDRYSEEYKGSRVIR